MNTADRLILIALAVAMWVMIAIQMTVPAPAYADLDPDFGVHISAYDVDDLKRFVVNTVEKCTVSDGEHISC